MPIKSVWLMPRRKGGDFGLTLFLFSLGDALCTQFRRRKTMAIAADIEWCVIGKEEEVKSKGQKSNWLFKK